ncbi:hypothetical protein [Streptosporangium sp. NPDC049046]|uniref:hypothetical protein n=1 Tax=unclassified Streptosporangium TaxID=2632669 RepID=UPI00343499E0
MTVRRRQCPDLPEPVRAAIEEQVGPVAGVRSAEIELTSRVAAHLTTTGVVFFMKAAPAATPVAGYLLGLRSVRNYI